MPRRRARLPSGSDSYPIELPMRVQLGVSRSTNWRIGQIGYSVCTSGKRDLLSFRRYRIKLPAPCSSDGEEVVSAQR